MILPQDFHLAGHLAERVTVQEQEELDTQRCCHCSNGGHLEFIRILLRDESPDGFDNDDHVDGTHPISGLVSIKVFQNGEAPYRKP